MNFHDEGQFGNHGEFGVGFSDSMILVVSLVGFCFLGFSVYNILVLRLKTREEIEKEEEFTTAEYEERLVRSDVVGLSRAERRARARAIMKQQRRVQNPRQNEEQQEGGEEADIGHQQNFPQAAPEAGHDWETAANMSRKERKRLAKAKEKEERKRLEDKRRKEQKKIEETAQKEKRERKKLRAIEVENERKKQRLAQEETERERDTCWNTFLSTECRSISVEEWIEEVKGKRSVSVDQLADRFGVSSDVVVARIDALIAERRLSGIISSNGSFIYLSDNELELILDQIKARGVVSRAEVVAIYNSVIFQS